MKFLNQVRVISSSGALLALYALENRKNEKFALRQSAVDSEPRVHAYERPKLQLLSPHLQPVSYSPNKNYENFEGSSEEDIAELFRAYPVDQDRTNRRDEVLKNCIAKSRQLCWSKIHELAIPGLVVAVSVNGKLVWKNGFGFADLENNLLAKPESVMRIASISKSLTMTLAAKLWEEGKLDLDKPVREYVEAWPENHPEITVRHIVSHLSGVRHYYKKEDSSKEQMETSKEAKSDGNNNNKKKRNGHDTEFKEFYLNRKFESVTEALDLFKDDQLLSVPGEEFNYTTHGFTLLSAVIEKVVGEPFEKHIKRMFKELGLENTYLDENEPIIYNRARFYTRNKDHKLVNAANVDNSYKWAGGGFLSTVENLVSFGNAMLYSYQAGSNTDESEREEQQPSDIKNVVDLPAQNVLHIPGPFATVNQNSSRGKKCYLKQETVQALWSPIVKMSKPESLNQESHYGMGWVIVPSNKEVAFGKQQRFFVSHTGGAIGASSVLLILPPDCEDGCENVATCQNCCRKKNRTCPEGVVVAIICNIDSIGLTQLGLEIAKTFESLKFPKRPFGPKKVFLC